MKPQISFSGKIASTFLMLIFFGLLYSCQEIDQLVPNPHTRSNPHTLSKEKADIVYEWYKFMAVLQRNVTPQPLPFTAARAYAYIGVGLFESVQPGIRGGSSFSSKLYQMPAMPKPDNSKVYLWQASANAALASMFKQFLTNLSEADRASIDAKELAIYNNLLATNSEDVLQRSVAFGRSVAEAIFNWSGSDNYSVTSGTYVPLNQPWAWIPTPPTFAPAIADNLQHSRPFLKYTINSTVPPVPVPFSEDPTSEFFMAAKEVHDLGGTITGTASNMATASWWADAGGPGVGLPAPYHFLSVITSVLESQNAGLWKAAEVYAKTGIAFKDGPINTFRAKYHYNFIRPITYIRRHIDANWLSHLGNPPYPEYPSGLVGFYSPVIQVLIQEFGDIPATDNSYAWRGLPARQFSSLSQMRKEASDSRIYAGIHYRFTQDASIEIGVQLGNEIDKIRVVGPEY
ncbi:MAG TPA: vanadium-dependent haloperoxidase [Algoriphagus sp.]|nr:vanadium-dependent haloperoxidase [Algoriphagus sp.]